MINFENVYATVFNPSRNDRGVAIAGLGTGRKQTDKNTNEVTYVNSSWGNTAFLGDASNKFDNLNNLDRIYIKKGRIERVKGLDRDGNEIKDTNGRAVYYLNVTVFDFVMANEANPGGANSNNTTSNNSSDSESDLPF